MANFQDIFSTLRIILFGLIILVAAIYSIPILFIRRFHHRNNILTLNICLATIFCCLCWFIFYIMLQLNPYDTYMFLINSCVFMNIVPAVLTLQIPLSFVTISINRFYSIVYHNKHLFKTKQWITICIVGQWILGTILILPILSGIQPYCDTSHWIEMYKLIFIVVVPFIVFLITNILIYINIRSSTNRVQSHAISLTENNSSHIRQAKISRRDVHLLRHMIVILLIFLVGWSPLYVLLSVQSAYLIDPIESACFTIWCQLALLCDIIDLYLYNHEIRNYLKTMFCRYF